MLNDKRDELTQEKIEAEQKNDDLKNAWKVQED